MLSLRLASHIHCKIESVLSLFSFLFGFYFAVFIVTLLISITIIAATMAVFVIIFIFAWLRFVNLRFFFLWVKVELKFKDLR